MLGLLTVYADNEGVELSILVHLDNRRQGIARALFKSFEEETASYPIQSVIFQTEHVFLNHHPSLASHWGVIEDEETETWLRRGKLPYALDSRLDVKVLLTEPSYLEELTQLHHQAFFDAEVTLKVTHRYIAEALKDSDSLLYILLKDGKIIGVCTVDVSGNSNYLYDLL